MRLAKRAILLSSIPAVLVNDAMPVYAQDANGEAKVVFMFLKVVRA